MLDAPARPRGGLAPWQAKLATYIHDNIGGAPRLWRMLFASDVALQATRDFSTAEKLQGVCHE
jgi:hypothetical protein